MKTLISFFLISLTLICNPLPAQVSSGPASYSYPIFVITGGQQFTGTAFLYKSGDSTFLVSNYHAIKGMSPVRQRVNFLSDTLYFKYKIVNSSDTKLLSIDVSEEVTGKTEIFSMVDRIDLFKIAVTIPGDADVRYLNDLIDPAYFDQNPEEVVLFGFPPGSGPVPVFYSRQQRLAGQVNPHGFEQYDASLSINFPATSDSARAILSGTAKYYYFLKPYAAQGFSGAPVLGKFRDGTGRVIYRFLGVVFAGQPATRQTWAIKAAVAVDYLENQL